MRRAVILCVLSILFISTVSASQITREATDIRIDTAGAGNVTVERHYAEVSPPQISYFVPAHYQPRALTASDDLGELDCMVRTFESGKEILCTPRKMDDYTVEIHFFGDFVDRERQGEGYRFSFVKQVLTPTTQTALQVTLPEGYGLVKSDDRPAYRPDHGAVGSAGRRIFIQWERNNVSIGDTTQYVIRYEPLQVLDQLPLELILGAIVFVLSVMGAAVYYVRNNRGANDTIAAVFPVLKDDEQLVIRYIIDKEGEVEQREIVSDVSYSKAKISKLLSDLEERHLIEKEKQGRVNIVKLTKDIGELAPPTDD